MKKVVVVVVLILLLIGGYFYMNSKRVTPKVPGATTGSETGGNVFTSIKDALSQSMSLKCVYKDEKGVETTSYIKAGAVRVVTTGSANAEQPGNIVIKDQKMYIWSDTTKTGFTYDLSVSVSPAAGGTKETGGSQEASVLAQIEKYKDACKAETISDSMFTVPTDVTFQDMNALQEQMMKKLSQPPQQNGANGSSDYNDYIKQMMQQQQGTGQ